MKLINIKLFNSGLFKSKEKVTYSQIKLPRTIESTIFEVFMGLEVLIVWVICGYLWSKVDSVPTHFNAAGEPDAWGNPVMLIFFALLTAFTLGLLAYCAYRPKYVNSPVKPMTIEQFLLNARMVRVLGVIIGLLFIVISLKMGGAIIGISDPSFAFAMLFFVLAIMGVAIGFSILVHLKRPR